MPESTPPSARPAVRYEERDDLAIITLNRPERLNTLTEPMVRGVAEGIDAATASRAVRAVVLPGRVLCGEGLSRSHSRTRSSLGRLRGTK
jgi:1,4-dihydroxy-2-naphthoyl-CoA synthase